MTIFDTLSLGELIAILKKVPGDREVRFDFGGCTPGSIDSYRGFYNHLAIAFHQRSEDKEKKVLDLLTELIGCIGKRFEGYKGGTFTMHEATPIWVGNWGESYGTSITGVDDHDWIAVINTSYVEL